MSDNRRKTDDANPYAAPVDAASGGDVLLSLPDGRLFRVEGDSLICPAKVDLSEFCFHTGEDLDKAPIVFRRKIVVQGRPTTFFGRLMLQTAYFAPAVLMLLHYYVVPIGRMPFPFGFLLFPLTVACIAACRVLIPRVVIQSAFSLDGDNAYASSNKWLIITGAGFICIMICTTLIVLNEPQMLPASLSPWVVFLVMMATGALLMLIMFLSRDRRGVRGQLRTQQSAPGVFKVEGLPTGLLRSLSDINA